MSRTPHGAAPHQYLDARVSTASQPELQLVLLDGALRFGRQALAAWDNAPGEVDSERCIARMIDVLEELVRSVSNAATEASKRLVEEYAFIYRSLAQAKVSRQKSQVETVMKLLAYQRETWRLACDKVRSDAGLAASRTNPVPTTSSAATARFSLEA